MCREIIIFSIYLKKMKRNKTKQNKTKPNQAKPNQTIYWKKPDQTSLSTD